MLFAYGISIAGKSHIDRGKECEDACDYKVVNGNCVIAAVADGVGSASHSGEGAKIAVKSALEIIEKCMPRQWDALSIVPIITAAFSYARKEIIKTAEESLRIEADYDTTLSLVVYNGEYFGYGHCGDGGIVVLDCENKTETVTARHKGEEYNVVIPLRGGAGSWEFGYYDKAVCAILLMTDGVFDFAHPPFLDTPYNKFVIPFLRARCVQEEDIGAITNDLATLFKEGELYERITDDKTLVGVINNDFLLPELTPEDVAEPDWAGIEERRREALYATYEDPDDTGLE